MDANQSESKKLNDRSNRNPPLDIIISTLSITVRLNRYSPTELSNKEIHSINGNVSRSQLSNQKLKILHQNIRGGIGKKMDEIKHIFDVYDPDILAISESNFNKDMDLNLNSINYNLTPGFTYSDHYTRLIVFTKKGLKNIKTRFDLMKQQQIPMVWLEIKNGKKKLGIIQLYREFKQVGIKVNKIENSKPEQQLERLHSFLPFWEKAQLEYDDLIVMGDMNLDHDKISGSTHHLKALSNLIKDRIFSNDIKQRITTNTWTNGKVARCLDHIYTSSKDVESFNSVHCTSSDHNLISCVFKLKVQSVRRQFIEIRNMSKYDPRDFQFLMANSVCNHDFTYDQEPETQVQILTAMMESAADLTCPRIKIEMKAKHTKWANPEFSKLIKERNTWHKEYLRYHDCNDWRLGYSYYCYNNFKKFRNKVKTEQTKIKKKYYESEVNNIHNPKNAWKKLDEISGRNPCFSEPISLIKDNLTIDNPQDIANNFATFFPTKIQKIKDSLPTLNKRLNNKQVKVTSTFDFKTVTGVQIQKYITELSSSSASGHDSISNKLLKDVKYVISGSIAKIINNCIKRSSFPETWKLGKICALHKKGNRNDINNYRPITLLSSLSKLFEKALFNQITEYMRKNELFDPRQYGFRNGMSCNLAILDLVNHVLLSKESISTSKINALFFDLSAAFDIVDHKKLIGKLKLLGFKYKSLKLIESYLKLRPSYVEVERMKSKKFLLEHGVPQGSILGPLLYILYIGDIQYIDNFPKIIYADDTSCIITANNEENLEQKTNLAFENVISYYGMEKLKINPKKTEILALGPHEASVKIDPTLGTLQNSVKNAKVLGHIIDKNLSFHRHAECLLSDINYRILMFKKITKVANMRTRLIYGRGILLSKFSFGLCSIAGTDLATLDKLEKSYNRCVTTIYGPGGNLISIDEIFKKLQILPFRKLIDYFDLTTLKKIIISGRPLNLHKYLLKVDTGTRQSNEGNYKVSYIPKTSKLLNSFIPRSVRKYNCLNENLKQIESCSRFSKRLKLFLLGISFDKDDPVQLSRNMLGRV